MLRRVLKPTLAVLASATMVVGLGATQLTAEAKDGYGPPYNHPTELMGDGGEPIPLKNKAMISRTDHGYRFRSGQQDGHLTVTKVRGGLRFVDTGTREWRSLGRGCERRRADKGVAAFCRMPGDVTRSKPLLLEIWPRLGNDFTDGRTLPRTVAMSVLADAGRDVTHLGKGRDFANGAQGRDLIVGRDGRDWLRGGKDADVVRGGGAADYLVATHGRDRIFGGAGDDKLYGGDYGDRLYTGRGSDVANCGGGGDYAKIDGADRVRSCESRERR